MPGPCSPVLGTGRLRCVGMDRASRAPGGITRVMRETETEKDKEIERQRERDRDKETER